MARFDAVLFDAGGVLVLPDPTVLRPLLAPYGGADDTETHRRAHYAGMAHKSRERSHETDWDVYNVAYVDGHARWVPDLSRSTIIAAGHPNKNIKHNKSDLLEKYWRSFFEAR